MNAEGDVDGATGSPGEVDAEARGSDGAPGRVRYDHTGSVVLVTGGTRGLGAGIADAFLAAGAEVVVCARRKPETLPDGLAFVAADVRDAADVDRLVTEVEERYGRLDTVVNNAGGSPRALLAGTSPRLHARVVELNLIAPLLVAQRAHPLLAASGGSVVMIGSSSGTRPSPGTSAYGAAKAGLHHLAACLAAEWAPRVRVNTVVVGLAETEDSADHYGGPDGVARMGAAVPAGRMALPADVAGVCLWLAVPGYVTGAEILVHGGGEIPAWRRIASGHDG
ncbi:SDR family oxidoreductase [Streptosporangium amethystogenes subsp. fukuiense]|uniref:SDR family oxidoreductase n=1 Tax=Streptosporangium amethystogenes subsp. fukuiense TaxID=698418 RepID=A0ABW2T1T0_9ACTN